MNPARQFEVHPDAEILNGFVENALPEAERNDVLAHLGGCGRCREIVYLAQDATPVAEAPARAAMAERRIVDGEPAWILRWKTAWAAGFAFAAIAALAVFVTVRHGAPTQEVAKLAPSPAPAAQVSASPASSLRPVPKEKAVPEVQAIAPGVTALKAAPRVRGSAGGALSTQTPAATAPPPASASPAAPAMPAEGGPVPQAKVEAKLFAPSAALDLNAQMGPPKAAPSSTIRPTRLQSAPEVLHNQLSRKTQLSKAGGVSSRQTIATIEVNSAQAGLQPEPVAPAQAEMTSPLGVAGAAAEKKSGLILLPSGLPLVSTAEAGHTQLAVDAVGSLFLSQDMGKSWQPVDRQWTGQLMKVRIAQGPSAFAAKPFSETEQAKPPAPVAASIPAALFEIVNDKNAVWTSVDGKTWTAK
jgi:Putative zinc-finger